MLAGAALLAVLDGTILSATPDLARDIFAIAVTIVVGGFIVAVWRSNSKMEKAATEMESTPQGGKPPSGGTSK